MIEKNFSFFLQNTRARANLFFPFPLRPSSSYLFRCHSNRNGDMLENTNWFAIYVWEFSVAKKELLRDLLLWPPSLSHFHRIIPTIIMCSTLALWLLIGKDLQIPWLHYSMNPYIISNQCAVEKVHEAQKFFTRMFFFSTSTFKSYCAFNQLGCMINL